MGNKQKIGMGMLIVTVFIICVSVVGEKNTKDKSVNNTTNSLMLEINDHIEGDTATNLVRDMASESNKGPFIRDEKIAYITIDDGPSKHTEDILDILKKHDIKATFFMMNNNMEKYPDAVNRIVEEGHSVGFHSVTHDKNKLYTTPEATVDEFDTCKETFKEITGKESNLIRIPYGSKPLMPQESYYALLNNDYQIWDWNLDTEDWKSTTDKIVSNVLYQGIKLDDVVLLMHEKEQSVESLEFTIKVLKERGYTMIPISQYETPKNFWLRNLDI